VDHLLASARLHLRVGGDRPWLVNGALLAGCSSRVGGREVVMLGEVEARVEEMVRILHHHLGVGRGEVVQVVVPGNSEWYFPVLATWALGGVLSPSDPSLSSEVLASMLDETGARVVICCRATLPKVRRAREVVGGELAVLVMDADMDFTDKLPGEVSLASLKAETSTGVALPELEVEEHRPFLVIWSSGTTGRPKGIQHGTNIVYKTLLPWQGMKMLPVLQTTCFFHIGGILTPLLTLVHGTKHVFLAPEDLDEGVEVMMAAAEASKAATLICGSHHLIQLAALKVNEAVSPVPSVTTAAPLGTNVYSGIAADLRDKFPAMERVMNLYGQSEGGSVVSLSSDQRCLGSITCPAARVVDPDTGAALGPGEVGEIMYRSETPMIGYLNNPEENAKFFGPDGFLHSGDLGHYDAAGCLYYDGRMKELIKYKNHHLYPNELEEIILAHESVEDAAIFGRSEPSVQELVTALVVKKKGVEVDKEELQNAVDEKVDDHKKLRGGVYFVDKIPRNPQGKILRRGLGELVDFDMERKR